MFYVSERCPHDDSFIAMLLVIVVNFLNGLDTWIVVALVGFSRQVFLVPVQDATDKGGDKSDTGLGTSDGLSETEEQGEVAVDTFVAFELFGGLDAFPGGGYFDEYAIFFDADRVVEGDKLFGLGLCCFLVERETGIDFCGDSAGDDVEDLFTELDQETVESGGGLVVERAAFGPCVIEGSDYEMVVCRVSRGCEDEGRVCGSILDGR